jgi:hypothetical protein
MSVEINCSLGETSPHWLNTPRGRRDLFFIATFVLLNVLIPLLIMDLYPFSRAPMFADAPQLYCAYQLYDQKGNALDVLDFGLHRNYWGNPVGEGVGFKPPLTLDQFGVIGDPEAITTHVQGRLRQRPDLAYVDVVQEVIGDEDGRRVGVIRKRRWRVENPVSQGRQQP